MITTPTTSTVITSVIVPTRSDEDNWKRDNIELDLALSPALDPKIIRPIDDGGKIADNLSPIIDKQVLNPSAPEKDKLINEDSENVAVMICGDKKPKAETGIFAELQNGTPPVLDGNFSDSYWSGDWDVYQEGSRLTSIKVKHDEDNLYFAVQWTDNDVYKNEIFFYFEDDGTSPDKSLDGINEDCKYMTNYYFGEGSNQEFADAHWDSGWSVAGEYGAQRDGLFGASNVSNVWHVEASIPLSTGSIDDINVTSEEILGFMLYTDYGQSSYPVGGNCFDPLTWTYLHVSFNTYPDSPTNPSPSNGANGVITSPTLSVTATDPDGDSMDVSFYNASDDSLLGTDVGVPDGGTASFTWSGLAEGTHTWYAVADDGTFNTTSSTWSFTTYTDNPTWDPPPIDQIVEYGDVFSYDLNASDSSGIDHYWINDTTNFNIDSNGVIANTTTLDVGVYWLEVRAYDPYGNYCSATFKITVEDTTDPTWDYPVPTDPLVNYGDNIEYDLDASDLSGIDHYWTNDTTNFNIDNNGVLTNKVMLAIGIYGVEVRAYDPYGNYCSATIKFTVHDTRDPFWVEIPSDQTLECGNAFSYDLGASDLSGIDHYWTNDTTNFNIDSNGIITDVTTLAVGVYWLEIRAYDPYDNYCSATFKVTVEDTTAPTISITTPANDSTTDQSSVTIEWTCNDAGSGIDHCEVFLNGIFQGTTTDVTMDVTLASDGNHNITVVVYDNVGNENKDTIWIRKSTTTTTSSITTTTLTSSSPPTPTSTPGFLLISLISGLIAVALTLLYRRRQK